MCSSDLGSDDGGGGVAGVGGDGDGCGGGSDGGRRGEDRMAEGGVMRVSCLLAAGIPVCLRCLLCLQGWQNKVNANTRLVRKSVVKGKSLDLGGTRILRKKIILTIPPIKWSMQSQYRRRRKFFGEYDVRNELL